MTVRKIEFSGRDLAIFNKEQLISCLDINPHLVANYKVFPKAVRLAALEPALVVETADLTEEQHRILVGMIGLITGLLAFETPSSYADRGIN